MPKHNMVLEGSVGVVVSNSLDYVRVALDQINQGKVVVNLRSEDDSERLKYLSEPRSIIATEQTFGWSPAWDYPVSSSASIAQVLFSSGTEGEPKAILLSHHSLSSTTDRLISIMEMNSDIREYVGVPVYYSFGFGRCRAVSRAGGLFFVPEHGFNPLEISEMLGKKEINAISAVPTLWRMLLSNKELFENIGGNLRWIEIGSQYMSGEEKTQLKALFPNAKIVQHYGLTEASRSTFLKVHELDPTFLESVGQAEFDVDVAISDEGAIKIRGPHISSGILSEDSIESLLDADGWFVTKDSGYIENNYLYYIGRTDDVINCGGIKLSPDVIEKQIKTTLSSHAQVVVCKKLSSLRGEEPAVVYVKNEKLNDDIVRDAAIKALSEQGVELNKSLSVVSLSELPVTETGKVKRKVLSEELFVGHEEVLEVVNTDSSQTDREKLIAIWEEVLKVSPVGIRDSFFDLGGDSLSAISAVMKMEKAGLDSAVSRQVFQGMTIAQILNIKEDKPEATVVKSSSAVVGAGDSKKGSEETPMVKELVQIWEEVLKVSPISVHDSFFELGGDSLSAISAVMKMEKAGLDSEVSRLVFQGKTIVEILGLCEENEVANSGDNGLIKDLITIWEEVLKVSPVSVHDSFFDLGGDSLSAITATLKMEKAGIPKDICKYIFEGRSIAQIVDLSAGGSGEVHKKTVEPEMIYAKSEASLEEGSDTEELSRTPLASLSRTLDIVRAVLVLFNIMAHWIHGLLARLPFSLDQANQYLSFFYSSGTPGFAMVFGMGVGAFMLPRYIRNAESVMGTVYRNAWLLAAGILCLSLVRICADFVNEGGMSWMDFSNSFFSVLTYYFYGVLSLPIWLKFITRMNNHTHASVLLAVIFYGVHQFVEFIEIPPSDNPLLQHFVLMLTATYNYFEMSAGVLIGIAFGIELKKIVDKKGSLINFAWIGGFLMLFAFYISVEMQQLDKWLQWPKDKDIWTWPLYAGFSSLMVYLVYKYWHKKGIAFPLEWLARVLGILGIMAFPMFVGHEMVSPAYNLLDGLGVPFALPLVLLMFVSIMAYLVTRLYKVYYGYSEK